MGTATYFVLGLSVLVVLTVVLWRHVERDARIWRLLLLTLIPLTIIFDSLCIAVGIFGYSPNTFSGLKLGPMPVEDLFYTLAAIIMVPAFWKLYGGKKENNVH